jgi:hypothetical protein
MLKIPRGMIKILKGKIQHLFLAKFLLASLLGVCYNRSRELGWMNREWLELIWWALYITKWSQLHGMLCTVPSHNSDPYISNLYNFLAAHVLFCCLENGSTHLGATFEIDSTESWKLLCNFGPFSHRFFHLQYNKFMKDIFYVVQSSTYPNKLLP